MNSLVIGNTSQLSHYFPNDYIKISSRNIDYNFILSQRWEKVFLCFGESRKYIDDINIHDEVNFYLTLEVIDKLKNNTNNIIIYSSCELWNQYDGKIDINKTYNFYSTPYLQSKYKVTKYINQNKKTYDNVIIIYPFNFNSIYRTNNFLFGKIFDSIKNKKIIEIGDTYFYRDMIHPTFVVNESINATEDKLVGSGRLTFVNDFIRDLYSKFDMNYDDYVNENTKIFKEYDIRKEYYLDSKVCLYSYDSLITDTINDIKKNRL